MLLGGRFFRKRPRQHELGLEHGVEVANRSVQRCSEISMDGVSDPSLDVGDCSPGVAFVPSPIEWLGRDAELDNEVAAQIRRRDFAPFPATVGSAQLRPGS